MDKELKHGSASTYSNQKCRCDECREAWRIYARKYRDAYYLRNPEAEKKRFREYWYRALERDPVGTRERQRLARERYNAKKSNML